MSTQERKEQIDNIAMAVLKEKCPDYYFSDFDIVKLIHSFGDIGIFWTRTDDPTYYALHKKNGKYKIYFPDNCATLSMNRFMIAKEFGHYILNHIPESQEEYYHRCYFTDYLDGCENDAHCFACCLLMPKDKFTDAYNSINGNQFEKLERLSEIFKVPFEAVSWRVHELNLCKEE